MRKFIILLLLSSSVFAFDRDDSRAGWECVAMRGICITWRLWVPEGWVVASDAIIGGGTKSFSMTYVPDLAHVWVINK